MLSQFARVYFQLVRLPGILWYLNQNMIRLWFLLIIDCKWSFTPEGKRSTCRTVCLYYITLLFILYDMFSNSYQRKKRTDRKLTLHWLWSHTINIFHMLVLVSTFGIKDTTLYVIKNFSNVLPIKDRRLCGNYLIISLL